MTNNKKIATMLAVIGLAFLAFILVAQSSQRCGWRSPTTGELVYVDTETDSTSTYTDGATWECTTRSAREYGAGDIVLALIGLGFLVGAGLLWRKRGAEMKAGASAKPSGHVGEWQCLRCAGFNPSSATTCGICGTVKPGSAGGGVP